MKHYINREISWLSFNERVLQEAEDTLNPLIERIRFLGIFSNNQDEFFRVRVASIKRLSHQKHHNLFIKPQKLLKLVAKTVLKLQTRFRGIYQGLINELEKEGIYIINETQLNPKQAALVTNYFRKNVRPLLVPVMLHHVDKMPVMLDHTIYLAVILKSTKKDEYALIKIPSVELARFFVLPEEQGKHYIILLDDIIRYCISEIFNIFDCESYEAYTLKVTRDAELDISSDLSKSYLEKIRDSVKDRENAPLMRFVYDEEMPVKLLSYLLNRIKLKDTDSLIPGGRYHNFKDFMNFPVLGRKELVHKKFSSLKIEGISSNESIIQYINQQDLLLNFPYHSFNYMIDLLREAAIDPKVKSIKITLYRVAKNSMVINALINAAKNGKEVTAVMEIRARFDELNNIAYASKLQASGIRVIFADPLLKVHCKLCLISRFEKNKIVQYANISNGNYHEGTSNVYSDLSLFTKDKRITTDVNKLFKFMKHTIRTYTFDHFVVSPRFMRDKLYKLIDFEIEQAKAGKVAWLRFKMNNLTDYDVISKLYEASSAGVKIELLVRGICCLVPEVPRKSENIKVISILDRYLEHSRFYIFANTEAPKVYIASADLMPRNLDNRIEIMCPVYSKNIKQQIIDLFHLQWNDDVKGRVIDKDLKNEYQVLEVEGKRSQVETYNYLKTSNKKDDA